MNLCYKSDIYVIKNNSRFVYFFLTGLRTVLVHFLHLTNPARTFMFEPRTLDLHLLHTNIFLNFLASASGNLTILSLIILFS